MIIRIVIHSMLVYIFSISGYKKILSNMYFFDESKTVLSTTFYSIAQRQTCYFFLSVFTFSVAEFYQFSMYYSN